MLSTQSRKCLLLLGSTLEESGVSLRWPIFNQLTINSWSIGFRGWIQGEPLANLKMLLGQSKDCRSNKKLYANRMTERPDNERQDSLPNNVGNLDSILSSWYKILLINRSIQVSYKTISSKAIPISMEVDKLLVEHLLGTRFKIQKLKISRI